MLSRAFGQGTLQERLQNKIIINRTCLQEPLAKGSPRKGSRTRLLSSGNAFQSLWPRDPQESFQNKIISNRKCLPEPLAKGPPSKGSRTRLLSSGDAFQSFWPRVLSGKAQQQDCDRR